MTSPSMPRRPSSTVRATAGAAAALVLATVLVLSGCGPIDDRRTTATDLAPELALLPTVVSTVVHGDTVDLGIRVDAPASDVLATLQRAAQRAAAVGLRGGVRAHREPRAVWAAGTDTTTVAWDVAVYPTSPSLVDGIPRLLAVEVMPGSVSAGDAPPSATFRADVDAEAAFTAVRRTGLFDTGGTFTLVDPRRRRPPLTIVWVPSRTSEHLLRILFDLHRRFPEAEIALEAATPGPQWPHLYIAGVLPVQFAEIARVLRDPALEDADVAGYPVPFTLTATIGSDAPPPINENLGGLPG